MSSGEIKITKLDAARRQLRTAIELWFNDGEPVSIHTLACSAHQIIHDLNRKKKGSPLIFDSPIFKEEYKKEAVRFLKNASNFFKHADFRKQQVESIDFIPRSSDMFILFSVRGLQFLRVTLNDVESAFWFWTVIHNPHFLTPEGRKIVIDPFPINDLTELRAHSKKDFLYYFLRARRETAAAAR